MQFDYNKDDDKEKSSPMGQQSVVSAPMQGAMSPPQQQAAQPKGTSSGRFQNLQNVLKANQGNTLGQSISGRIGGMTEQARSEVDKSRQAFQQQTAQAFKPFEGGRDFYRGAIAKPTEAVDNQADFERFQTIAKGQYGGPTGLANTEELQRQAEAVRKTAALTASEGGRESILSNFFSRPSYTSGQRGMDQLLLQTDPNQLRELARTRAQATAAGRAVDEGNLRSFAEAQGKAQEAKLLGQEAVQALGTETTTRDTELAQKLEATQARENQLREQYAKVYKDIQAGQISESEARRLGLLGDQGLVETQRLDSSALTPYMQDYYQSGTRGTYGGYAPMSTELQTKLAPGFNEIATYGQDIGKAIKTDLYEGPMTKAAVASEEQARRLNALARLALKEGDYNLADVNQYKESTQALDQAQMRRMIEEGAASAKSGIDAAFNESKMAAQQSKAGRALAGESFDALYGGDRGALINDLTRSLAEGYTQRADRGTGFDYYPLAQQNASKLADVIVQAQQQAKQSGRSVADTIQNMLQSDQYRGINTSLGSYRVNDIDNRFANLKNTLSQRLRIG